VKSTLRRIAPALLLLILAPLIAEFLLGDFSVRQLAVLLGLLPQYGGGALLVRETARRRGKGWSTIILLALAYALIEEGLTTQSLFNPNYAGQRLLDYGYIAALGTSLDWTVFVLTIHIVWSIGCGIAIAEAVAGERWDEPWLRTPGYVVAALLFVVGCIFTVVFTMKTFPYVATPAQFAAVVVLTIATIVLASRWRSASPPPRWTWSARASCCWPCSPLPGWECTARAVWRRPLAVEVRESHLVTRWRQGSAHSATLREGVPWRLEHTTRAQS
jgi:hypothetical protein